jgi:hypothetical protein
MFPSAETETEQTTTTTRAGAAINLKHDELLLTFSI